MSCTDNTGTLGVYSDDDIITTSSEVFQLKSRTVILDSVVANTVKSYLGVAHDAETGADVKAEFMAQFHTFEDYRLPDNELLVKDADGRVVADSVEIRLYFTDYYGDANNPIKIGVYELRRDSVLREDWTYYSDISIDKYIPAGATPLAEKVFTAEDYTLSDSERTSSTHYKNVRIVLPVSYGQAILQAAVDHPEYFVDSWHFMRNVCPGFAFRVESGRGTMLSVDVGALNIYFRYGDAEDPYLGVARFAATPEVIQTTAITNRGVQELVDENQPYTWLKSPAGLATEVALPVDEIFLGHERDSVSKARLMLTRINSVNQTSAAFGPPSTVLLVRSCDFYAFFDEHRSADEETSYTTDFSSAYNVYSFSDISELITYLYIEKHSGMAAEGLTSEQWNDRHPDWNRVIITPVVVKTVTNQSSGTVTTVSVSHDFSLTSTRLVGGTQPFDMQVIYSRYK